MEIRIPSSPLRWYQDEVWTALDKGCKRVFLSWHRRSGKDHFCLNYMLKRALQEKGVLYYIFPTFAQGRKIIWDDAKKMDMIPKQVIKNKNSTEMKLELINGSIIQIIGSDHYDSLRGTDPRGIVMSEYAYQHPLAWEVLRPILAANGGWVIFNSTPNGKNHNWELREYAKGSDRWYISTKTVDDTKSIALDELEEERRSMDHAMFLQEYYCSFDIGAFGSYYGEQMEWLHTNNRIGSYPYDPALPIDTFWDIGIDDSTAISFVQSVAAEVRFVDYFETNGKGFDAILSEVESKGYRIRDNYMPHDFNQREFMIGETRLEYAKKRGFNSKIVPKIGIDVGIDVARRLLKQSFFDKEKCKGLIRALENYHKEYDSEKKVFINRPTHDWSSHAADSLRYCAVAKNTFKEMQKEEHRKNFLENRNRGIMWENNVSPYSP